MYTWPLDRQGFVTHYMVSGPLVTPFSSDVRDKNQLRYEAYLRSVVAEHTPVADATRVSAGENSRLGLPWRFQGGSDGAFVNLSDFYATMQRVAFDAATVLIAPKDMTVQAVLWGYTAVDVYCNGENIGGLTQPVYKPIGRAELTLPLRAGANTIYLACETLGVRDTRSVVGLQIASHPDEVQVTLPDAGLAEAVGPALSFLESAELTADALIFSRPAPAGTAYAWKGYEPDFAKARLPVAWQDISGAKEISLPDGKADLSLRAAVGDGFIQRHFERTEQIRPQVTRPVPSYADNLCAIFRRIADVESLSRGEKFGFPIANILARKYLNDTSKDDFRLMEEMLELIEERVDCSDFLMCGLIRYLKNYPVPAGLEERVRHAVTHFRYWMDQDGFDGMCFWSENHCLMFYSSAMQAGEMYPDAFFPLAGMTGAQLHAWGKSKVLDWLDDVEQYGFEEFLSTVYMCVTFAALINVVDYAEDAISARAVKITDQLLYMLAMHTFKGGIIAPQGRVYRGVLYPFAAGAMALMNLSDPAQPYDYGEGWLGFYATSHYQFPAGLPEKMARTVSTSYTTGNARIVLEKREDWCLTSVQIPREPFARWENETKKPDADPSSHAFVKSYNECFHGTTCFQPGVHGYQQHLWYAALDGEAAVFINHPGSSSEGGDMRPGYWHGNGVFPALKQQGNVLGLIYRIPDSEPFHYVHLYCPECRFDEVRRTGSWLLLRKGSGSIGLWSSVPMEPWTGMNVHCEQRMWGSEIACLCVCAGREVSDLDAFERRVRALTPRYDAVSKTLFAEGFSLTWQQGQDDTQVL